jgi:hypothetical protein
MNTKLLADNIIEHMRLTQEAQEEIRHYFHWNSKLWRAIEKDIAINYIDGKRVESRLIDSVGRDVANSSASSGVSFRSARVWYDDFVNFALEFHVSFEPIDDDTDSKSYTLVVPDDLELNFTQEKFDLWAASIAQKRNEKQDLKDRALLKELLKKYRDTVFLIELLNNKD